MRARGLVGPFNLDGRVAVVTGGNGGIGFGVAAALGDAGAALALWARDADKTERALRPLHDAGVTAIGVTCDVTDEDQVKRATAETVHQLGRLDICVANAGGSQPTPFLKTSLDTWNQGMDANLTGTFLCFRETALRMVDHREGGALIAVSSIASRHAAPLMHVYAAAKAGLGGLVRSLAVELAPERIRCNALVPGFTENERLQAGTIEPEFDREVMASIPVGRWGTPADLGAAAVYLADPSLAYQTGAEVVVDGGYSIMPPYLAVRASRSGEGGTP
jgi:NAD(P)-dependent dehydrogenase (short-subunit alcohol dehydrogenase family)